jgi:hypothetical protein
LKLKVAVLSFTLLFVSMALVAQSTKITATAKKAITPPKPFSEVAVSAGVGLMGVNLQAATNVNKYMNLRATGNIFNYTVNNITTNGFNIGAKVNMATAGASVDFYPFWTHGFRLSPGVQFYNQNALSGTVTVTTGQSFTLDDVTYYSAAAPNQVQGTASVGLHVTNPAFTMTTGWGNMIPRKGGHWSFPFELGAAFVGTPAIDMALTTGKVCANQAGTIGCVNVLGDATLNANLQAQIAKYKNDLDPLKVYPILSFGVSYSFRIRK